jgi:hypothetical protein
MQQLTRQTSGVRTNTCCLFFSVRSSSAIGSVGSVDVVSDNWVGQVLGQTYCEDPSLSRVRFHCTVSILDKEGKVKKILDRLPETMRVDHEAIQDFGFPQVLDQLDQLERV